ncbi:hypothetical protein Pcinc_043457 [Petrolisthes cinctipes]|uniref:Uncharacterized protein n=1 Tax=Petrolisthes cinctipes TaxID=88211 RepID=A0AAE1BFK9_PETCI|nr:hypothetical protein Pcinc_043457 [Petrolisthes cinctipes]
MFGKLAVTLCVADIPTFQEDIIPCVTTQSLDIKIPCSTLLVDKVGVVTVEYEAIAGASHRGRMSGGRCIDDRLVCEGTEEGNSDSGDGSAVLVKLSVC